MTVHNQRLSKPLPMQVGFCSHGGGHGVLQIGHTSLSLYYKDFLHLADVIRRAEQQMQQQRDLRPQQVPQVVQEPVRSLLSTDVTDPVVRLAYVLSLLQAETDPVRIKELRCLADALDEEVRQQVRQYAREQAALVQKKKG